MTFRDRVADEMVPHNPPGIKVVVIKDTGGVVVEATTEGEGDTVVVGMEEAMVAEEGDMMVGTEQTEEDMVDIHLANLSGLIVLAEGVEGVEGTEEDLM